MEILFSGTSPDCWPIPFCRCALCREAVRLGGKNIRSRCSLQLGSKYKVDFPADSYMHMLQYGLSYADLEHLFITHTHHDHFYPMDLTLRWGGYVRGDVPKKLHIYGSQAAHQRMLDFLNLYHEAATNLEQCGIDFNVIQPFEDFRAGELDVMPILASHDKAHQICLNYVFQNEGKTILQGFDTGWYSDETWEKLGDYRLDMAIMDCTYGGRETDSPNHLWIGSLIAVKEKMEKMGILSGECRFIATHFGFHLGGLLHHELEERLNPFGIEVAYDGMKAAV
ncbi:MAG: hypothetical protein B1H02_04090 [Candidatus Latescibacteria bacterium 4484_107]|nr:MAG: hypothetical protein B1H02_04090 [Candidatus Latescibacteria bacterium 4484_107]